MNRPTLTQLNLKPLCPTVIGSSAFPGWYAYFQDQVKAYPEHFGPVDLQEALEDARRLALEDQVKAGIELVTDGEMGRVDFNLGFYDALTGIVSQTIPTITWGSRRTPKTPCMSTTPYLSTRVWGDSW